MNATTDVVSSLSFAQELRQQRWDDHRFYHQSRVTQSLHLFSALCFLTSYALLPFHPVTASLFGWTVAMWSRQIGHFFFEPKGFDRVNYVTFGHKEEIKVGFAKRLERVFEAETAGHGFVDPQKTALPVLEVDVVGNVVH